jgi:putative flippase GtrA
MTGRTPFAYVIVSGLCLILHNAVLIVGDLLGMTLWLGVLISFIVVASVGYVLHAVFTFRQPMALPRFGKYVLAMSVNIPLAFATTWFWNVFADLPMMFAAPIASACMLALNFALGRWAITPSSDREAFSR